MGFRMAVQWAGLVRGEGSDAKGWNGANRRANGRGMLMEMMGERASKSVNLDRSRSDRNVYDAVGIDSSSGSAVWDAMVREADEYRVSVHMKDGRVAQRRLPGNAVIGWSIIVHPPEDVVDAWGRAKARRFFLDVMECLREIGPDVFSDKNIRAIAEHHDEGTPLDRPAGDDHGLHWHVAGSMRDADGRYDAKHMWNIKLFGRINAELPAMLRGRGWDIEDLDTFDLKRKDDEGYRAERRARRSGQGLSANDHARRRAREAEAEARAERDRLLNGWEREDVGLSAELARERGYGVMQVHEKGVIELRRDKRSLDEGVSRSRLKAEEARSEIARVQKAIVESNAALAASQAAREAEEEAARRARAGREAAERDRDRAAKLRDAIEGDGTYCHDGVEHRGIRALVRERDGLEERVDALSSEVNRLQGLVGSLGEALSTAREYVQEFLDQVWEVLMEAWRDHGPWQEERDELEAAAAVSSVSRDWGLER